MIADGAYCPPSASLTVASSSTNTVTAPRSGIWVFCKSIQKMIADEAYCPTATESIHSQADTLTDRFTIPVSRNSSTSYVYCESTKSMILEGEHCTTERGTEVAQVPQSTQAIRIGSNPSSSRSYVYCESTQTMVVEGADVCPVQKPLSGNDQNPSVGVVNDSASGSGVNVALVNSENIGTSPETKGEKVSLSNELMRCDQQVVEGCILAAKELCYGKGYDAIGDDDARKRMSLRLLERASKLGSADATLFQYDIYDEAKLPSFVAVMALQKTGLLEKEMATMDRDDARVRVAHYHLTSYDPIAAIMGSLDGRYKGYCDSVRLLRVKGKMSEKDMGIADSALNTIYCKR